MQLLVIVGILALVVVGGLAIFFRTSENRRLVKESLKYVLIRVSLQKEESQPHEKAKEEIGAFEQFLGTLQGYRHPVVMEISVAHIGEEIHFYFAANRKEIEALERAIHAFWPGASVERTKDYNIFNPQGETAVGIGFLREHFALPIRGYRHMDADPLVAITNAFSNLAADGEGAALQCIFSKAPPRATKTIRYILNELRRGVPRATALKTETLSGTMKFIGEAFFGKPPPQPGAKGARQTERDAVLDDELIKLVSEKSARPLLAANLRVVASAASKERAGTILDAFERALDQFTDPRANRIALRRIGGRAAQQVIFDFSFRNFRNSNVMALTTEECASIAHLPTSVIETPRLERLKTKTALAPLNLPSEGLVIGKNVFRGEERLVRILPDDRRQHMYIVGQTGTGKTALLQEMARQDIEAGEGVAVIDPHGDLAETILGLVPHERMQDVIYFNPTDIDRPIGLNILEFDQAHPEQKTFVINEMIEIMDKLYDLRQVGGPMFEQYLRNAMLLIMGDSVIQPTVIEIPKVLADAEFRKELLNRCANPSVVSFWTKEAERAGGDFALANMVPYITSKLNPFIANDIARPIIGQTKTPFRLRDIMDQRKILIVNLAKGVLGETNSYLLGMIVVGKILMAALSRADMPEEKRRDFYLYIDEFHNVTTRTVASILAEARKYRLSMIIAHQFIAQLKDEVRDAIFGNVGTMAAFRVGPIDADLLEKQFAPVFTKQDLVNLDNYCAYIKLLIRGQTTKPFNIQTFLPRTPAAQRALALKSLSRETYGRQRQDVETEIASRIQM